MEAQPSASARRQARFKEALRAQGIAPVNVLAPVKAHEVIKEIAQRARAGEPLHKVLRSLAMRATNEDARWAPLAVPDDLVPGPGEVAVAIRIGRTSNGYTRRLIDRAGLQRRDQIAAWCGIVSREMGDKLAARAETTSATVARRDGAAE